MTQINITEAESRPFIFDVMSDVHFHEPGEPEENFRETADYLLKQPPGAFLVTCGDYDNVPLAVDFMERHLLAPRRRTEPYPWFAAVGNHDIEGFANNPDLNGEASRTNVANIVKINKFNAGPNFHPGPASRSLLKDYRPDGAQWTTFSFDYRNLHCIVIDQYCALAQGYPGRGTVDRPLIDWLEDDLCQTTRQHVVVFGHEPLIAFKGIELPEETPAEIDPDDVSTGCPEDLRRVLRNDTRVAAYVCGHSHRFGITQDGSCTHVTAAQEWTKLRMFLRFHIDGPAVAMEIHFWQNGAYHHETRALRP